MTLYYKDVIPSSKLMCGLKMTKSFDLRQMSGFMLGANSSTFFKKREKVLGMMNLKKSLVHNAGIQLRPKRGSRASLVPARRSGVGAHS